MSKMEAPQVFRKLPVEITAWQWDGSTEMAHRMSNWINDKIVNNRNATVEDPTIEGTYALFLIHTLEGDMQVNPQDYVIRGVKGEFYPCKPDIFEATYEVVES